MQHDDAPPPPWAPLAGAPAYELGALLGRGAHGAVHVGRHATGSLVALKLLPHARVLKDERARAHLSSEVACALRLQAASSTQAATTALLDCVLDARAPSGEPCVVLVLELHPRGELMEYLLQAPLGEGLAAHYGRQLLQAVAAMHDDGTVAHRDLKPDNLLLDASYRLRVSDFGLARLLSPGGGGGGGSATLLTTMCGTPLYQSPELVAGSPYDGTASDAWACGVIIFILISGAPPFGVCSAQPLHHRDYWWMAAMRGCWPDFWRAHRGVSAAFSPDSRALVEGLLAARPALRLSARAALAHPWLVEPRCLRQLQCDVFECMDARRRKLVAESAAGLRPALPPLMREPSLDPALFATRATMAASAHSAAAALASVLAAVVVAAPPPPPAAVTAAARADARCMPAVGWASAPGPLAGARTADDPSVLASAPSDPVAPLSSASMAALEPGRPSPLQQLQLAADYTMLEAPGVPAAAPAVSAANNMPLAPLLLRAMSIDEAAGSTPDGEAAAVAVAAAPAAAPTIRSQAVRRAAAPAPAPRSRVPVHLLKNARAAPAAVARAVAAGDEAAVHSPRRDGAGEQLRDEEAAEPRRQRESLQLARREAAPAAEGEEASREAANRDSGGAADEPTTVIVDEHGAPLPVPTEAPQFEWRGRRGGWR